MLARQTLAYLVLQRELAAFAIEEVGAARLDVAGCTDDPQRLVERRRAESDVETRQALAQRRVVLFPLVVPPVDTRAIVEINGADELVGAIGEDRAREVDPVLGVGFD